MGEDARAPLLPAPGKFQLHAGGRRVAPSSTLRRQKVTAQLYVYILMLDGCGGADSRKFVLAAEQRPASAPAEVARVEAAA
jgi:hypothetical protein